MTVRETDLAWLDSSFSNIWREEQTEDYIDYSSKKGSEREAVRERENRRVKEIYVLKASKFEKD